MGAVAAKPLLEHVRVREVAVDFPYSLKILRALAVEVVLVPQQHEPFPLEVSRRVLVELAGHAPSPTRRRPS